MCNKCDEKIDDLKSLYNEMIEQYKHLGIESEKVIYYALIHKIVELEDKLYVSSGQKTGVWDENY